MRAAADLSITKTHAGNFTQGQSGTYTLSIGNGGGTATNGSVTVTDLLPGALVPTAASGPGWTCEIAGQAVNCTRNDALSVGQSYPAITLTVSAPRNAPASVTNTAHVSGGGETNASNNTANDPTIITPGANLTLTKSHMDRSSRQTAGFVRILFDGDPVIGRARSPPA